MVKCLCRCHENGGGWIDSEVRIPTINPEGWSDIVLITDGESISIGYTGDGPNGFYWQDVHDLLQEIRDGHPMVTHWRPLPSLPRSVPLASDLF